MAASRSVARALELEFYRALNRVVEPMVRAGFGSLHIAPSGFIVLETCGRKTGRLRRSPLVATRIGDHVLVGTFRGKRSQWVHNLVAQPYARFWLAGRPRNTRAFVMHEGKRFRVPKSLPQSLQQVVRFLAPYTSRGWAFALLSPRAGRFR